MAITDAKNKKILIDISSLTMLKVLLIIFAIAFIFYIKDIVFIVFVALILASAFDPWIDWLQKNRIPRAVGILMVYLSLFFIIFIAVYSIITPITLEINDLAKDFPFYWEKVTANWQTFSSFSQSHGLAQNLEGSLTALQTNISGAAGNIVGLIFSFFGGVISLFVILVMTFYITVEDQAIKKAARSFLPAHYQPYFMNLINRIQEKIGLWLRGQLLLSLIIFAMCWLGLTLLGVKYALVLALFAGVTELIPYLGPFIGAVPAVFVAFAQSPILGVMAVILYLGIQQAENYLIVPKVMQRAVGLNPIVVIVVMLVGAKLAGILGIILSVPVTTALSVALGDIIGAKSDTADLPNQ